MSQYLDSNLFSAFKNGEHAAFRLVFNMYYRPLFYFTKKLIDHKEEAEEITLNSFQKLFERCGQMESAASIKAFLFITARNNSFDYLRTSKVQKQNQKQFAANMQDETFLEYEYEIKDQLVEMVRKAVNNLPSECSRIFKMLYYDELSPNEVAEVLQISVSTVYTQKSRAIQVLRMALANHPMAISWLLFTAACDPENHITSYSFYS
jgi:RNA polymerase sigma-70 factor (family 1)